MVEASPHPVAIFQATFRPMTKVSLMSDKTLIFNDGEPFGQWSELAVSTGHGPLYRFQVTWHWSGEYVAGKMKTQTFCRCRGCDVWISNHDPYEHDAWTMYLFPVTRIHELV